MTQEFHISVTPVGQNDYLVRTEQVAPGVPLAEELVTWPVADWLTAAGHLMNDPLKSVLQGEAIARNSINLVALGQQLYNALFQGTLRDSLITAQGIAQNHQKVLRLRVGLKDPKLARLPWEVMHAGDRPLATGPYIAFSRYQSGISSGGSRLPSNLTTPDEPGIRVLMAIASPTDQVRLDLLKLEALKLQAVLYRNIEEGNYFPQIELTLLEQPGREELTQALEQGRYHVLHYSGHSNLGPGGGEIYLVNSRTGLTETLNGDDLAGLLVNNNIQMAVFNSCLGAYTPTSVSLESGERNLTESLVKRGIKSVLAMSERIPDDVALTLTQLFYHNLSQGHPVDLCVSRMRQGLITAYGAHQMYWALPILYLQPEFDGRLSPEIYLSQNGADLLDEYDSSIGTTPAASYGAASVNMPLPIEDILPPSLARNSSELDWLGEDTWGDLVDEIEYDDPTYAEDSALVSDLFRQLDDRKSAPPQSHMTAELVQSEDSLNSLAAEEIDSLENEAGMWAEITAAAYGRNTNVSRQELPSFEEPPKLTKNFEPHWKAAIASSDQGGISLPRSNRSNRRKLCSIIGGVSVSAIATIFGLSWWQHQQLSDVPQIASVSQPNPNPEVNLKADATGIVTAYATDKLTRGDLPSGLMACEELLNRNALNNAKDVLDRVPQHQADNPAVNFLKGRLAWQSVRAGDNLYSLDDARRYWEAAVKAKPDSLLYSNALGYAYYAEGNVDRANDSWFKALSVALKHQNKSAPADAAIASPPLSREALTAYAGLALGMYKSAHRLPANKQQQYISEAVKLRQMVQKTDTKNYQPDNLGKNWLWTPNAVEDWRSLLQQKGEV